jgi:hypothetical protein
MFKRLKLFQFTYNYRGTQTTALVIAYTFDEAVEYLPPFLYDAYVKGDVAYSAYEIHTGTMITLTH